MPENEGPISTSLRRYLDDSLASIPSTKTGQVKIQVSLDGYGISVAERWGALTVSAYAGKDKKAGIQAGGEASISW